MAVEQDQFQISKEFPKSRLVGPEQDTFLYVTQLKPGGCYNSRWRLRNHDVPRPARTTDLPCQLASEFRSMV